MNRNFEFFMPLLQAIQENTNVTFPRALEKLMKIKVVEFDLSRVEQTLHCLFTFPKSYLTFDFSKDSYEEFTEEADLEPIYFLLENTLECANDLAQDFTFPIDISLSPFEPLSDFFIEIGVLVSQLDISKLFALPGSNTAEKETLLEALGIDSIMKFFDTIFTLLLKGLVEDKENFISRMLVSFITEYLEPLLQDIVHIIDNPKLEQYNVFDNEANFTYFPRNEPTKYLHFGMREAIGFFKYAVAAGVREKILLGTGTVKYPLFDDLATTFITTYLSSDTFPDFTYKNNSDGTAAYTLSCNTAFLLECLMLSGKAPVENITTLIELFTAGGFGPDNFASTIELLQKIGSTRRIDLLAGYHGVPSDNAIDARLEKIAAYNSLSLEKKSLFSSVLHDAYKKAYFPDVRNYTTIVFGTVAASDTEDTASLLYNSTVSIVLDLSNSAKLLPSGSAIVEMEKFVRAQMTASQHFLTLISFVINVSTYNLASPYDAPTHPTHPLYDNIATSIIGGTTENPGILLHLYNSLVGELLAVVSNLVGNGTTPFSPAMFGRVAAAIRATTCDGFLNIFAELGFGCYLLWLGCCLTLIAMLGNLVYFRAASAAKKDNSEKPSTTLSQLSVTDSLVSPRVKPFNQESVCNSARNPGKIPTEKNELLGGYL